MDLYNQINQTPASPQPQPTPPPAPRPTPTPPPPRPQQTLPHQEPHEKKGVGAIVGTIIIIILLAIGALYFWGARLNGADENPPPVILGPESANTGSNSQANLPGQAPSDEPDDIYADIEAMNIDGLERENQDSEAAFNAGAQ